MGSSDVVLTNILDKDVLDLLQSVVGENLKQRRTQMELVLAIGLVIGGLIAAKKPIANEIQRHTIQTTEFERNASELAVDFHRQAAIEAQDRADKLARKVQCLKVE